MREYKTKLVGVSFNNRQKNIKDLKPGFRLFFIHEKDNIYDANSILVYADPEMKIELGHLRRELAAEFVKRIAEGVRHEIFVDQVTGGEDKKSFGVNVRVMIRDIGDRSG